MDIGAVKTIVASSNTLVSWSMTIIAASLLALLSTSYLRPVEKKGKWMYVLFLPAWILLGVGIYCGSLIERRGIMAAIDPTRIPVILDKMNDEYASQLTYFNIALAFLGAWLILFLFWWLFTDTTVKTNP